MRRAHQPCECTEGVLPLLPVGSQNACQNLLRPCALVGAIATPSLPGDHGRSDCLLCGVIGGFDPRAMKKGKQMGLFMAQVLGQSAIGRQAKGVGEQSVHGVFEASCSHIEAVP